MSEIHRVMYNLIVGMQQWQKSSFKDIPKQFLDGFQQFIYLCAKFDVEPPLDIPSLIQRLQLPASEWGIPEIEQLFPSEGRLLDLDIGLSLEADEFLEVYAHPNEYEQAAMKDILVYCRDQSLDKEYCKIRTFLSMPKHAVIAYQDLYFFLVEIGDEALIDKIKKCYEEISDLSRYRKCPHCGWTLEWINGNWRCNKENVCHVRADFHMPEEFPKSNMRYFRMTRGIHRYTLLPGISEHNIAERLSNKGYSVQMYPEIDNFDILVKCNGQTLALDVKDFYNPFYLAQYICQKRFEQDWNEDVWYVIPSYRLEIFPAYIQQVKIYIRDKINENIRFLSEGELYKKVGALLV
ncbi:hypothetical protein [Lederbergia ruris]|uniref:restriction endonuclease-related protein n=1 Tax=Lederbergia ruris TaxID=217495 RepID=UPI0039A05D61